MSNDACLTRRETRRGSGSPLVAGGSEARRQAREARPGHDKGERSTQASALECVLRGNKVRVHIERFADAVELVVHAAVSEALAKRMRLSADSATMGSISPDAEQGRYSGGRDPSERGLTDSDQRLPSAFSQTGETPTRT